MQGLIIGNNIQITAFHVEAVLIYVILCNKFHFFHRLEHCIPSLLGQQWYLWNFHVVIYQQNLRLRRDYSWWRYHSQNENFVLNAVLEANNVFVVFSPLKMSISFSIRFRICLFLYCNASLSFTLDHLCFNTQNNPIQIFIISTSVLLQ